MVRRWEFGICEVKYWKKEKVTEVSSLQWCAVATVSVSLLRLW